MTLRFRDTLGGELKPFRPLRPEAVGLYTCGPTVYGPSHVGNFRSFVFADLLRRYLGWRGFDVTWVVNITDVDDRIIREAKARDVPIDELTAPHIERFLADWRALRITEPDVRPRATHHIEEMAAMVSTLLERGRAYRTDDGSIFFRISSWPSYGRLARLDPEAQRVGERVEADDYGKDDVRDFALWKAPKPGEPSWSTPIGDGRPGWHIECSAMSQRYLGSSFDLHTGGVDLIFPHHEDELAQAEAATGETFVGTWLHCAHLRLGNEKMARRTGRFDTLADVEARGYSARVLRYALLAAHYRGPLDYSDASLRAAQSAIERLSGCLAALDAYREERADDPRVTELLSVTRETFITSLDDDLAIAPALAAVFDLVRELNRRLAERAISTADASRAAALLRDLDRVLAVAEDEAADPDEASLPDEVRELLAARASARAVRDWATADELRSRLLDRGIAVDDTRDGQRWRPETRVGEETG